MNYMFEWASVFNQPLLWDTANVQRMYYSTQRESNTRSSDPATAHLGSED